MTTQNVSSTELVPVRPYARLLTMLGEQLIKNDRIALVELIKNSYDADATTVNVDFLRFGPNLESTEKAAIAITDNGEGMTDFVIRKHWLNPATPGKAERKRTAPKTKSGRVLQGEKGIGRFAIFKIGSRARIITRGQGSVEEFVIEYDLAFLDRLDESGSPGIRTDDGVSQQDSNNTFLDEIEVSLTRRDPEVFDGRNPDGIGSLQGTRIEILSLRSNWSDVEVRKAFGDVARLQPLVPPLGSVGPSVGSDFQVSFQRDGQALPFRQELDETLKRLFNERAVLHVSGLFDADEFRYELEINGSSSVLDLEDSAVRGLRIFKRHFADRSVSEIACGPFFFTFYVFDFGQSAPDKYKLDRDERATVREHRIYLYRDSVRVLPYGDPEDDWLQLDVIRGTQGASRVLSNDQTVGFVYISHGENPNLRDKTNREGLIESGQALGDFVALLQILISYIRRDHFARYLEEQRKIIEPEPPAQQSVAGKIDQIVSSVDIPEVLRTPVRELEEQYRTEREFFDVQIARMEDLAGVGLSVEAASHDIIASASRALRLSRLVQEAAEKLPDSSSVLVADATAVVELLSFVTSRLQDIQGLFVSTRQRRKRSSLREFVERVQRMYSSILSRGKITFALRSASDLKILATEAAILQVLINFFDNSVYWLEADKTVEPSISVTIDPGSRSLYFADNGPGVRSTDEPFIFEPFYSGKGDSGKGLGLYIARQVGARGGFKVSLTHDRQFGFERGAIFQVDFSEVVANAE